MSMSLDLQCPGGYGHPGQVVQGMKGAEPKGLPQVHAQVLVLREATTSDDGDPVDLRLRSLGHAVPVAQYGTRAGICLKGVGRLGIMGVISAAPHHRRKNA